MSSSFCSSLTDSFLPTYLPTYLHSFYIMPCAQPRWTEWRDGFGHGVMHVAATHGQDQLLNWLLTQRAPAMVETVGQRLTPLHCAAIAGQVSTVSEGSGE